MNAIEYSNSSKVANTAIASLRREAFASRTSQQELANALGLSRYTVNSRLLGHSLMSMDEFVGMAHRLGLSAGEVLAQAEAEEEKKKPAVAAAGNETRKD